MFRGIVIMTAILVLERVGVWSFQFHGFRATQRLHRSWRHVTVPAATSIAESSSDTKARLIFLGTPDVAAASLKTLVSESKKDKSQFEVVCVVTQPPKRRKRRGKDEPSPVGIMADQLQIPVLAPEKANDADFLQQLIDLQPHLCITAAYGQYLPKKFLAIPTLGTLNIHPSLLPRWRGASPVQRSLQAGDNPIGVSVLFTVSKMDAGPIVSQSVVHIHPDEDASTLLPHLFQIGTQDLLTVLPQVLSGHINIHTATQQDESKVVHAAMIDSSEGQLRVWEESARTCHNKVRAFSIWPGTFMYFRIGHEEEEEGNDDVKVKIISTKVLSDTPTQGMPTHHRVVLGPNKEDGLRITCGDGSVLEVFSVQPATRNIMDAKSFVNGLRGQTLAWVKKIVEPSNTSDMTLVEKT